MHKKSTTNPEPSLLEEVKGHGASAPKTRPNSPDSTKNRVILTGASPSRTSSTFTAPRKEPSCAPMDCGYTKPGKM